MNRAGPSAEGRPEPAAETASGRRFQRRGRGDRDEARRDSQAQAPGPREVTGAATAAAARIIRGGQAGAAGKDAKERRADDALWARAAAQHAAAQARRQARGQARPSYPSAKREPFRPWFTTSADDELWLNAEGTGEPWFTAGHGESER